MKLKIFIILSLIICMPTCANAIPFNSTWNTASVSSGSSNSTTIALPIESGGTYAFTVNWGDGNTSQVTAYGQSTANHTYTAEGIYNLSINGTINGFRFNNGGDRLKITDISQWGDLNLGNNNSYFCGCSNFNSTAIDALDLVNTTNMFAMFCEASTFNGNISAWDVSNVTSMDSMFSGASVFNQNISVWNTSNVTIMDGMFYEALTFNQDISLWNTSSVTTMYSMFHDALTFNQDISLWDTSSVTTMESMFYDAIHFNQDISLWDTSSVTTMNSMFINANDFNQNISTWDVSKVSDMSYMLFGTSSFNQNLGSWNVSSVSDMSFMIASTSITRVNYDTLLIGWSNLTLQTGVTFQANDIKYSIGEPTTARAILTDTYNWIITDGEQLYINVYIFNSSTGSYDNVSTRTVQPNQGLLIYSNADVTWNRSI